jgi:hypothetical protein
MFSATLPAATVWMDVLSADQHADAILAAYPFTLAVASGKL